MKNQVEVIKTEIAEYSKTALALADLQARYSAVVWDVSTTKGMAETKAARAEVRGYRVDLEAMRKEIKAPALERCRLIDDEAKRITAELVKLEQPIDAVIKAEEERKAAEKAEKERIEAERIAGIRKQIEQIKDWALEAIRLHSTDIEAVISNLEYMEIDLDQFAEFTGEAMQSRAETVKRLRDLMDAAMARESDEARLAADRKAMEEAKAKADAEAAEQRRIEAEKMAAQKAELDRQRAEQEKAAEVARSEMEHARAELERQQAEIKAQQDAIQKMQAAESARQQAEIDRVEAAKAERARQEAAEKAKIKSTRPSDQQIIEVLALHYRARESEVIEWILDMDLIAASHEMMQEFVA